MAIPEVNPVITGTGIYDTSFPNLSNAAISNIIPDIKLAKKTPCRPYLPQSVSKITVIAPVGPDI